MLSQRDTGRCCQPEDSEDITDSGHQIFNLEEHLQMIYFNGS